MNLSPYTLFPFQKKEIESHIATDSGMSRSQFNMRHEPALKNMNATEPKENYNANSSRSNDKPQETKIKAGSRRLKICLACSPGGHLLQMQQLEGVYKKHDYFFLTFKRGMTAELSKKEKVVFVEDSRRSPLRLAKTVFQSLRIFLRERPDLVIANGGGFVIPFCYIAKLFGKKLVFIESFSRVEIPSASGRLLYRASNLFIVQWKPLLKYYKKVVYGGSIF